MGKVDGDSVAEAHCRHSLSDVNAVTTVTTQPPPPPPPP